MKNRAYKILELSLVCLVGLTLLACHNKIDKSKLPENIGIGYLLNPNCSDGKGGTVDDQPGGFYFEDASRPTIQLEVGQIDGSSGACVAASTPRILERVDISSTNRNVFPIATFSTLNGKSIRDLSEQNVPCLVVTAFDSALGTSALIGSGSVAIDASTKALSQNPISFSLMTHKTAVQEPLPEGGFNLKCPNS